MTEQLNILTFDVEDWFHILDNDSTESEQSWGQFPSLVQPMTSRVLKMLDDHGIKATFFVLGYIAERFPDLVREISSRGHEIGSHGHSHQLVYKQTPEEFETDLDRSLTAIEVATGKKPRIYRAPGFSINEQSEWAFEIMARQGIEIDCSIFPAERAHGGHSSLGCREPSLIRTPRGNTIREFPVSTVNLFGRPVVYSGGGYFRLLPRLLLQKLFSDSAYNMTYFHPRDFEPMQPLVPGLSAARRFKSYVGLDRSEAKLRSLLLQFEFISISRAEAMIDWGLVGEAHVS